MNLLRYGIAVGLLAGLGACSNMGGSSAPRAAAVTQPTVAPEMVRQVQSKLRDSGYYKQGSVDGVWGSGTEAAVRSYQHDHSLTANGQLDVPTLQALNLAGGSSTNAAVTNPPPDNGPATYRADNGTPTGPNDSTNMGSTQPMQTNTQAGNPAAPAPR